MRKQKKNLGNRELRTECVFNRQDFKLVKKLRFIPTVDLFASHINTQLSLCHTGQILNALLWIHSHNNGQVWNFMLSHPLYVYPG